MGTPHPDSFGARDTLELGGRTLEIFRVEALQAVSYTHLTLPTTPYV